MIVVESSDAKEVAALMTADQYEQYLKEQG